MKLYRADKRDFNVGDIITSACEFTILNPKGSNQLEELFELYRPESKQERSKCLFLFEDLTVAKKHWSKMTDGKLYEVEVDEESILHRADMQLVDKAFTSKYEDRVEFAKNYWMGRETAKPKIEILANQAMVTNVISKDQDKRREYLKSWAII